MKICIKIAATHAGSAGNQLFRGLGVF